MKRLLFRLIPVALVALFSLAATGCNDSTDDSTDPTDSIVEDVVTGDSLVDEDLTPNPDAIGVDLSAEVSDNEWPDYSEGIAGAGAVFSANRAHFFDQPFPNGLRIQADGSPDFSDFPNPRKLDILANYKKVAQSHVDGFSPSTTIYMRFDGPLNRGGFPSVDATLQPDSPVLLVNVEPESPLFGQQIPVQFDWWDKEVSSEDYFLQPNVMMIRPVGGFPMRAGDRYACIVLRTLKDKEYHYLAQSPAIRRGMVDDPDAFLNDLFAPLREYVETNPYIRPEDVAHATVFKVANPTDEMERMARYVRDEAPIELISDPKEFNQKSNCILVEGIYLAPNFQKGDVPYETEGDIEFNDDGTPVIQRMEEIHFVVSIPKGDMPENGWPVVEYSHGTGGSRYTFTNSMASRFAEQGLAAVSIDQPLHGTRWDGPDSMLEFYSFNFMNPESARCLFRQAALDNVALTRFIKEYAFDYKDEVVMFDPDRIGYFGHSQGGLTGALFVAVEEDLKGAVLSGAGGGLAYTVLLRKELDSSAELDIKTSLEQLLQLDDEDELTLFHPVLCLVQTLVDATDPINYSPHYFYPRFRSEPLNVLITEGVEDPYTPAVTTENLALAGKIPILVPQQHGHIGFDLLGLEPVNEPVHMNMELEDGTFATAALAQFSDYGHFVAFDDDRAIALWSTFLRTALVDLDAVIKE